MCGVIGWATYGNPESFRHIPLVRLENCVSHCTKTTCRFSSINLLNAFASMSTRPVRNSQHVQTPLRTKNRDSIHTTRNPSPKCDSVQPTHREITPLLFLLTFSSNDLSTIGITIQKSGRFAREVSLTFLDALLRSDWRSAESLTAWVVKPCKSSSDGWRVSETPQCRTHPAQSGLGALLPSVFNSLPRKARIPTQRKNITKLGGNAI